MELAHTHTHTAPPQTTTTPPLPLPPGCSRSQGRWWAQRPRWLGRTLLSSRAQCPRALCSWCAACVCARRLCSTPLVTLVLCVPVCVRCCSGDPSAHLTTTRTAAPGHPQRDPGLGARPAHAAVPAGRGGAAQGGSAACVPGSAVSAAVQLSSSGGGGSGGGGQGRAVSAALGVPAAA